MLKPIRNIYSLLENLLECSLTSRFLIGGVLSLLALALVPIPTYADTDYSTQVVQTSDFKAGKSSSNVILRNGCNTVISDSGIVAVGARGSIFGQTSNSTGCGYHIGENNDLKFWSDLSQYSDGMSYYWNGQLNHGANLTGLSNSHASPRSSLDHDDYVNKNFRSALMEINPSGFNGDGTTGFYNISSATNNDLYGDHIFISYWKVPDGVLWSSLTPSVYFRENDNDISLTGSEKEQFIKDIYANTTITFGYPSGLIPADLATYLALSTGRHSAEDWEGYAFLIAYIPQYASSYQLDRLRFRVDKELTQNNIDQSLGCFNEFLTGLGNGCSPNSQYYPRFNYFYLSLPYTKNNAYLDDYLIQDLNSIRFDCISATCHDQAVISSKNNINQHNSAVAGYDWGGNNGASWFDVFKINAIFPFTSFFTSLTDNSCVDIPIIAGWLYNTNSHVCTYWNNDIRSTLTPVFMSLATMLLFGFIVSWLKGNSNNAFRDNDTIRIGDRF